MNAPTRTNYGQDDPAADAVVRETVAVANEVGVSAAQIALAWLRARPSPIIPIVGAVRAMIYGGTRDRIQA